MTMPNVTRLFVTSAASSQAPASVLRVPWLAQHLPDTEDQRQYARERCVVAITEALGEAIETAGLTQALLAERLGKTRGYVSKVLNGAHNMTLHTLGDILWACNKEVHDLELADLGVVEVATDDAIDWLTYPRVQDGAQALEPVGASQDAALAA